MNQVKFYEVTEQNSDQRLFCWEKYEGANRYCVEGLTEDFLYKVIAETEGYSYALSPDVGDKYVGFRLKCLYVEEGHSDCCIILAVSENIGLKMEEKVSGQNTEKIEVSAVKSFKGIALSFQTDDKLDEYQLFVIKKGKKEFFCSTNVTIVLSKEIKKSEKYYVEGFRCKDGKMTLCAKSEVFSCTLYKEERMKNKPSLSIVIPAYNCEDFLARTVDAVLLSAYKDTEIILVDDGSTDKTGKIWDWYGDRYKKITSLHIEHGGLCKARNAGMDIVKGDFLAFLDSDDVVHPLMYKRLVEAAIGKNSDIAIAQTCVLKYEEKEKRIKQKRCMFLFEPHASMQNVFSEQYSRIVSRNGDPDGLYFDSPCNKIIRTNIAQKVHFDEESPLYEDSAYTMAVYSYIDKFTFVKNAYYQWDCRRRITTGTISTQNYRKKDEPYNAWRGWICAHCYVLLKGNPDPLVARIYQRCVVTKLLTSILNSEKQSKLDKLFIVMMKYYVRICNLDMEKILEGLDPALHDKWVIVRDSPLKEYDGTGDIPKEVLE